MALIRWLSRKPPPYSQWKGRVSRLICGRRVGVQGPWTTQRTGGGWSSERPSGAAGHWMHEEPLAQVSGQHRVFRRSEQEAWHRSVLIQRRRNVGPSVGDSRRSQEGPGWDRVSVPISLYLKQPRLLSPGQGPGAPGDLSAPLLLPLEKSSWVCTCPERCRLRVPRASSTPGVPSLGAVGTLDRIILCRGGAVRVLEGF